MQVGNMLLLNAKAASLACWHSLITEFQAVTQEMSFTLSSAVEAKNELVTRKGFSAKMLIFERTSLAPSFLQTKTMNQ